MWQEILRVSATESEDLFLKDILDDSTYVKAILGGGYLGKTILYDVDGEKTVVYPNDGEHKTIVRNGQKATVFYGKYRGKMSIRTIGICSGTGYFIFFMIR